MNEEAEARFNQPMVSHSVSGIALFCIEVSSYLTVHSINKIFSHPDTRGHSDQASKILPGTIISEK